MCMTLCSRITENTLGVSEGAIAAFQSARRRLPPARESSIEELPVCRLVTRTPDERTRTYIMVEAIVDTLKQIQAAGGRVLTPRTEIGANMGAFAVFMDPVGNEFGLYEEPRSR